VSKRRLSLPEVRTQRVVRAAHLTLLRAIWRVRTHQKAENPTSWIYEISIN
jgi:hypothetical protein